MQFRLCWLVVIILIWEAISQNLQENTYVGVSFLIKLQASVNGSVLWKKVFLEISQNSQENTCARVSF